jgi:hypothetical protein
MRTWISAMGFVRGVLKSISPPSPDVEKTSGVVLASLKACNVHKEYVSAFRSLRPCRAVVLNIRDGSRTRLAVGDFAMNL